MQSNSPARAKEIAVDIVALAFLWAVAAIVVNPIGEFPLLDDWSYSQTVQRLLQTGEYRPIGWSSMSLVSNVLWGSVFCLPGGFSFTALRVSTIVAAFLGIVGMYVFARDLHAPRWLSLLSSLCLGFNPVYFALSYTFMTDVPFIAMAIWALLFLCRSLTTNSIRPLLIGTALAISTTLSRQPGLSIPLAFTVVALLRPKSQFRQFAHALAPLVLSVASYLAFKHWLAASGRLPYIFGVATSGALEKPSSVTNLLELLFCNGYTSLLFLGISLIPLLPFQFPQYPVLTPYRSKFIARSVAVALMTMGLGVAVRVYHGEPVLLPIPRNILVKSGIGPYSLEPSAVYMPGLPANFWLIVTAISMIGAVLLLVLSISYVRKLAPGLLQMPIKDRQIKATFLILCVAIYLLPFLAGGFVADRYTLPSLPFLLGGICAMFGEDAELAVGHFDLRRVGICAFMAAMGLFAAVGTHDYLAWNRVRWVALRDLMNHNGIGPEDIDGGFEFNGLYLFSPNFAGKFPYWVKRDTYQIGLGSEPEPGYTVIKTYLYRHWLPFHMQEVVVRHKNSIGR